MMKILFVDDEPHVLQGLQRFVCSQNLDCEHEAVTSAEAALERVAAGDIDVVVSDVLMPNMTGVDLLERLKNNPATSDVPVIMLTSHVEPMEKRTALQLGAYDFVNKPTDPVELVARVRSALRLKISEDKLRQQNEILKRQLRMEIVGLLAGGMFHDLNNMLMSIVGHTELASYRAMGDSEMEENLNMALQSAEKASRLVQQILHLGGIRRSEADSEDLALIVDDSLRLSAMSIPPGIRIKWSKPSISATVRMDRTQVFQVLMNLCSNAVKAMNGSGELTIRLTQQKITEEEADRGGDLHCGDYVVLEVSDTGVGIDPSLLETIFDPLLTTSAEGKGSGLGLLVVRQVLNSIGGCVRVRSALGEGSVFTAYFPCDQRGDQSD
ncbi:MAG: response regulator [candidate division Zixibacteria bacterium]|nr:response regulator [candidate division Zixibacteria bacterium]